MFLIVRSRKVCKNGVIQLGRKHNVFSNIRLIAARLATGLFLLITHSAHAVDTRQWNTCRSELAATGYTAQKQNDFCRRPSPAQWTCAQTILRKYHSLELAQETCLTARVSELGCFNQVLNRNFDPYVAKRVCKIK
ncbi:MAG: hypothetical protein B7Y39_16065 [Bdellovibrio sp. 28-41-41]|nr:MAG: hypothetical protein B7Y39_16065 [Bdellovibrio sp. 28-41-41]